MNEPNKDKKTPVATTALPDVPGATAEQKERNLRATTAAKATAEVAKETAKEDPWVLGPTARVVKGSGRVLAPGDVVTPELFGHTPDRQLEKFERLVKAGKIVKRSQFLALKK